MILAVLLLALGLVILSKGADWLVDGAVAIARKFGLSSLFIGLTIVAFGTSLPELFVNLVSAFRGSSEVALGNIVGSNLANTLLILGVMAIIHPPKLGYSTVWKEIPFSLLAAIALFILANDMLIDGVGIIFLTRTDGLMLLLFMAIFMYYLVSMALKDQQTLRDEPPTDEKLWKSAGLVLVGVVFLYFGGDWTVRGAVEIAATLGMSDYLIAATIIAIGTSLPELVTSVKAALRKNTDIAVGNLVGSNIFNVFFVLGVTASILPLRLPPGINFDLTVLIGASLLLFMFLFVGRLHEFKRWQGWLFVLGYATYLTFIIVRG
jgi:cation:H+ antiporter